MTEIYNWVDNCCASGVAPCNTDILNDCLMHLKYESGGGGLELCDIGTALYVDETQGKRRILNGSIVDINANTQAWLNRLLEIKNTNPDYFTDEETWQSEATLNVDGCVYKFVLNYDSTGTNVVSVRLPKFPDYVEVTSNNIPVAGNGITLGVTNGTSNSGLTFGQYGIDNRTNVYGQPVNTAWATAPITGDGVGLTTDPTKSGIQTSGGITKLKLIYFIQIATGSETENNIVKDIELNNPYVLFKSEYFEAPPYNISWLKSNGEDKPKATYTKAYEALVVEQNTDVAVGTTVDLPSGTKYTKRGLSVKLSSATDITDYDFVINTINETFRLPLKNHSADDDKSNLILYYYVGETVENSNIIDAGRIAEELGNKISKSECKAYVVETYSNGSSWYRIYSDNWCEQGGILTGEAKPLQTITFLKKWQDTKYFICKSYYGSYAGTWLGSYEAFSSKTTTSIVTHAGISGEYYYWYACGYIN